MVVKVTSDPKPSQAKATINLRCPVCRREGAFHGLPGGIDEEWQGVLKNSAGQRTADGWYAIGYRQCPNRECNAIIFFEGHNDKLNTYPPEVIDFDATNLPAPVLACLEEAVKCHAASCYRAAALMVRRTLEELCHDKNASGTNLKLRIQALKSSIVISQDLLDAADELRLLGNDAAHIEAKVYDGIESEEVDVAIELTKELLKAVYQHTSLVAKLRALKKP